MKQEFLHIFVYNNLVTASHMGTETVEHLFSNVHLSNLDKILSCLNPYQHLPIRLVLDTPNLTIKSFDITGMNRWHQYQLHYRLAKESTSEWHGSWIEHRSLVFIKGNLSDTERPFFDALINQKYLIHSVIPALWIVNNVLLAGQKIKENGVVIIPIADQFQQVLYLNGNPTISRISDIPDTPDWMQFVRTKYHLTLEVLDTTRLITSLGKATDSFQSFTLEHLPSKNYPNICFSEPHHPRLYYVYANGLKYTSRMLFVVSAMFVTAIIPELMDLNTHQAKIDSLLSTQSDLVGQYVIPEEQDASSKTYTHKRQVVEAFNKQTFPAMYFLERISSILPNYGQIIYIRIAPSISSFSLAKTDGFSIHLRLVPSKSSKSLQLLTSELHKIFGDKLRIHVVKNPTISTDNKNEATQLKHTVQVNMTGMIHELQKFVP